MRPFLAPDRLTRQRRGGDRDLLAEVLAALETVPIREALLPHPTRLIFGAHDPADGSITLATPLARVATFLHEATHHVRPAFEEPAVQLAGEALLRSLSDREILAIHRQLLARIAETQDR
jgi:hypothetical protein